MVAVLVSMGMATVWHRNRVLASGYEAVRLEREIARIREEELVEKSALAALTSPALLVDKNIEMNLGLERRGVVAMTGVRGEVGGRIPVAAAGGSHVVGVSRGGL
jgi:hypothetical protein